MCVVKCYNHLQALDVARVACRGLWCVYVCVCVCVWLAKCQKDIVTIRRTIVVSFLP